MTTVLVFAPHQDDELLTLGGGILGALDAGDDVHVILCTDGKKSTVRTILGSGEPCPHLFGNYNHHLTQADFTEARDKEFTDSCLKLGVSQQNIHIPKKRGGDGEFTVTEARDLIALYMAQFEYARIVTVSPYAGVVQHADHKALGLAAVQLYQENEIKDLELLIDPYFINDFIAANPNVPVTTLELTYSQQNRAVLATKAYTKWRPQKGRYAIGLLSVPEFLTALQKGATYYSHSLDGTSLG